MADGPPGPNTISELYRQFELPIYRYLLRLCGSESLAQELTQETFFQALTSIHRFQGRASLSTWLYKVSRNVYLNQKRGEERLLELEHKVANNLRLNEHLAASPERVAEQNWLRQTVDTVLQRLPEQYRTVILFKEVEGLSHREISDILGKTEASTKVLLFRAKQRFREEYDRLGGSL